MDPVSAAASATAIIGAISAGLKLVDQFRDSVFRSQGETPPSPGATAEKGDDSLKIVDRSGTVYQEIKSEQLQLNQWDQTRYDALLRRVKINWTIYNGYFAELPTLKLEERAEAQVRMDETKAVLCSDFKEMVSIYEHALNTHLPDHYTLYDTCGS